VTTQRSSLRALTLIVLMAHASCGGGKSEDKPPPPKTDGGPGPIAPPIAIPKSGVDRIERMNFQWGSVGSREYAKALVAYAAKGKPRDWNAIKGFAEASLAKDAQHLGSHWLLAAAHAQLGDHAAVVDHLVTAIAADFYNYGIKFATAEDLKPFLATKHGAAVQELAGKIREDYKQRVIAAGDESTIYTEDLFDVFWPDVPHRTLKARTYAEWDAAGRPPAGERPHEGEPIGTNRSPFREVEIPRYASFMPTPWFEGDVDLGPMWAGESAALVDAVLPAGEIVRRIAAEADEVLARVSRPE